MVNSQRVNKCKIRPGDQIESQGNGYGTTQIVENFYNVTSAARSTAIQASRAIAAEVGVYPQPLRIPDVNVTVTLP